MKDDGLEPAVLSGVRDHDWWAEYGLFREDHKRGLNNDRTKGLYVSMH